MATTLYFVQADTLPQIKLTLTDEVTGLPRDLTNTVVNIHSKPATGSGVRFSKAAIFPAGAADRTAGICYIQWENGDLNRAPGNYTAEIELYNTVTAQRETIYDTLTLVIREDIGDYGAPYPILPPTTNPPIGPDPTV